MSRKVRRGAGYELTLELRDDAFLDTPRRAQREWLLNRLVRESADELVHLDALVPTMVAGTDPELPADRSQGALADEQIMEDWQIPLMARMAEAVAAGGGDVLEIGMGRGVAADFVQRHAPRSHTLVECNDAVAAGFERWRVGYPDRDIRLLHGLWQDRVPDMDRYDGILFHTYPLSHGEFVETVVRGATFAEHFFDTARTLLRPGGVFTYLSNERDSLGRAHQRALLARFPRFELSQVDGLSVPADTRDAFWYDRMVLVKVFG